MTISFSLACLLWLIISPLLISHILVDSLSPLGMAAPSMKERQACWGARDEYWKCLDENTEDASKCKKLRSSFESSCPQQWVSYTWTYCWSLAKYIELIVSGELWNEAPSEVCQVNSFCEQQRKPCPVIQACFMYISHRPLENVTWLFKVPWKTNWGLNSRLLWKITKKFQPPKLVDFCRLFYF